MSVYRKVGKNFLTYPQSAIRQALFGTCGSSRGQMSYLLLIARAGGPGSNVSISALLSHLISGTETQG